ncbi:MAG: hypothetical protein KDD15_16360 [Lewinella sp.]|nr:hypothetical protein [Lewinella sp.]
MNPILPHDQIPFRNIVGSASTHGYVDRLVIFLEKYLPSFPIERNVDARMNENDLTEQLYIHLTRKAKFNAEVIEYPFIFQPEKSQKRKQQKGHSKRVDIAGRLNTLDVNMDVIYCLEAKKLPTDKKRGKREKEYVSGNGGAIERFKAEAHGMDDAGNLLQRNGIVAYVTDENCTAWHQRINTWISELGWDKSERLELECEVPIGKLNSRHHRVSGQLFELDHFWVGIS